MAATYPVPDYITRAFAVPDHITRALRRYDPMAEMAEQQQRNQAEQQRQSAISRQMQALAQQSGDAPRALSPRGYAPQSPYLNTLNPAGLSPTPMRQATTREADMAATYPTFTSPELETPQQPTLAQQLQQMLEQPQQRPPTGPAAMPTRDLYGAAQANMRPPTMSNVLNGLSVHRFGERSA